MTTPTTTKASRRSRGQMLAEQVSRLPYEQLVRFCNELAREYGPTAGQVREQLERAMPDYADQIAAELARPMRTMPLRLKEPAVPQPPEVKV